MKCTIPEISWHNREPVLSVDVHPVSEKFYRLATGGADCHVLIWQLIICDNGAVKIEALSDLTRHQRAVNSVRWAPSGQFLATGDDDANIIIWQLKTDNIPLLEGETNDKETWIVNKVMRGHKEDIYDICWSPDGQKLISGSIDNTAIVWDLPKGKNEHILSDHKGFVQGVRWDPKNHYLATISTDRVCRIYESQTKQTKARISRGLLPVPENHYLHDKDVKFFHDDTFKSFFRRLDFSPDGSLLVVPSGRVEIEDCKKILNAAYVFAVDSWGGPVAVLPSGKQCSTVARFCPILFELHEDGPEPTVSLPFRMIIAVGTDHDVILYDTQQAAPFAYFRNIHYTRLTDLTWSQDGLLLVASSTDGFCALITFEPDELGIQYVKEECEIEDVLNISGCEELVDKEPDLAKEAKPTPPRKPNLLEKWTIKTPKRKSLGEKDEEKKRIKPIPVQDKNQTGIDDKAKASPLMSFLKKGAAAKKSEVKIKRIKPTPMQPVVVLDEIVARDSWKCETDLEAKSKIEDKIVITGGGECTEDFSLHLEDTNTNIDEKQKDSKEESKTENGVRNNDENSQQDVESKKTEMEDVEMKDCVQVTNDETKDKDCVESNLAEQNKAVLDKPSVPKRRIPLITLSSPKNKKK